MHFFTTLHPLFENVLQTVDHFEISCLGAPFSWLEKPRNLMGASELYDGCSKRVPPNKFSMSNVTFNSNLAPIRFLGFSNYEKGAPKQEISK
jgi:hypothetical protein